ncbi:uncharacterized protein LOC134075238 isoform X2 [Sardina pilchardus]
METHLSTLLGLFILHLHLLQLHTVSAAVPVFVLEGGSVTLNVTGHEDKTGLNFITWKFHKRPVAVYTHKFNDADVRDPFKGRAEFDVSTFSLLLKNLQRSDSGLYTAQRDTGEIEDVADYELSVLEPAAAPTLTVVSNWSSSDSCNVTLNCTGLNVSLISSCNGTFCSQEGGDTFLFISFNTTHVLCNHGNKVSWSQSTKDFESLCRNNPEKPQPAGSLHIAVPISVSAVLVLAVVVAGATLKIKRDGAQENSQRNDLGSGQPMVCHQQSGEVESPGENTYAEPLSQTKCSTTPASTVYDTVQLTRLPASSSAEHVPPTACTPETVYAVVNKKAAPK